MTKQEFLDLVRQEAIQAGTNISIDTATGVISASGGGAAAWGSITGTLSSQTDLNSALGGKQATLVSGTNIKTINSASLLGSGNISIGGVPVSFLNVQDYGAVGDGSTDDYAAIQDCINTAVTTGVRTVFFPKTSAYYKITQPLIVIAGGTGAPVASFVTLNLLGESYWWQAAAGTEIRCTFRDSFCIGIQRGKGCIVQGLKITGIFTPPSTSNRFTFFNKTFNNFVSDGSIDYPTAVYSGIVVDPFTATVAPANEYPGLSSYYTLGGSTSGSTGVSIRDCFIDRFVVAIANSINGQMRNAELLDIQRVYFGDYGHKVCVVGTQAQEKVNLINLCASWGSTFCFFDSKNYGAASGGTESGNWNISNINVAGAMVKCFAVTSGGWFPTFVQGFYAESMASVGEFTSQAGGMEDCMFDFEYPSSCGMQELLVSSVGTNFNKCTFRYYGQPYLMPFTAVKATFNNCNFSAAPIYKTDASGYVPSFKDCYINGGNRWAVTGELVSDKGLSYIGAMLRTGSTVIRAVNQATEKIEIGDSSTTIDFNIVNPAKTLTLGGTSGRQATFTHSVPDQFYVNQVVAVQDVGGTIIGYAICTAISGSDITIDYCGAGIISGTSYYIRNIYPNNFTGTFIGDLQADGTITNAEIDWGVELDSFVGTLFYEPKFSPDYYMKITAYNAGTNTFTTLVTGSISPTATTGLYFSNKTKKSFYINSNTAPSALSPAVILPLGSQYNIFYNTDSWKSYIVTKTGFSSLSGGETRLANYALEDNSVNTLPVYADNAAAIGGGLSVNAHYQTATGDLKIVY